MKIRCFDNDSVCLIILKTLIRIHVKILSNTENYIEKLIPFILCKRPKEQQGGREKGRREVVRGEREERNIFSSVITSLFSFPSCGGLLFPAVTANGRRHLLFVDDS